ncbi:MAG: hypothetical protein ACQEP1_00825 [Nanobdellota archaeon]
MRKLLVVYDSSGLADKDKVRFYYALKGRDGKSGILDYYNIDFLSKKVLLVPSEFRDEIIDFLSGWKISYSIRDIIIKGEKLEG